MTIEHVDAVVVGSGFGGSVAALRLAEADRRVVLLERGKAHPPGSFPRDPAGVVANLWDPSGGCFGMFDIWSFSGLEAVVSSGLGGGSLIYANVLLRKDEEWFEERQPDGGVWPWPIDREALDPHYDAVEELLDAQQYPFDTAPFASTPKTIAMQAAAEDVGLEWVLPKLAVTFRSNGGSPVVDECFTDGTDNRYGFERRTCRLCGECDVGCNDGAKNTLDLTMISRAEALGAEVRTLAEVRRIGPRPGGGYAVTYVQHDPHRPRPKAQLPEHTLHCDRLVLAAGAFGTPYLLLRNHSAFPGISGMLGTRFCGNGDLLTFLRGASSRLDPSTGPVITSAIRSPGPASGPAAGRGFYVEDGGNPAFLSWLTEAGGTPALAWRGSSFLLKRAWSHLRGRPRANITEHVREVAGDQRSAYGMPILAMGRDTPDGTMSLADGGLEIDWSTSTSSDYFDEVERTVRELAESMGAKPKWLPMQLFKRALTVHPLGGCPMGHHIGDGVIDDHGEVFGYPGLFVVDGSAMPGPVGPNPSLTIAAFADRAAEVMVG